MSLKKLALIISFIVCGPLALACIPMPKSITLSDTSYASRVNIGITSTCHGNSIAFAGKFHDEESGRIELSMNNTGDMCFNGHCGAKLQGDDKILDSAGHVTGILQVFGRNTFVFSVDEEGQKDLNKPYMKFEFSGSNRLEITAYDKGKSVGSLISTPPTTCTRSLGFQSEGVGTIDLRNSKYTGSASCGGGFEQQQQQADGGGGADSTTPQMATLPETGMAVD